jgi:hypothetical protein
MAKDIFTCIIMIIIMIFQVMKLCSLVSGSVNICENFLRRSRVKYSPIFTEPEANNSFSIIFKGEYQQISGNKTKHGNTDAIVRSHTFMRPSF